jgi:hypothetical protein
MPHIPRTSMAPSNLTDPGFVPRAPKRSSATPRPATPYKGSTPPTAEETRNSKNPMLGDRLNMQDWDVDPVKIMRQLLGQEIKVDEYSGMVSRTQ